MAVNAISFNKASAREFGWKPMWFGVADFGWDLIKGVKAWQRAHAVTPDGLVGAVTFRKLADERQSRGLPVDGSLSRQVLYNRASAHRLGWKPSWFGVTRNNEQCVEAVKLWQGAAGIQADGMVGDSTFRRKVAERDARAPVTTTVSVAARPGRQIIYNGDPHPIDWPKVVLWTEEGGLKSSSGHYRSWAGRPPREIRMFVNHWDATTSARQCWRVIEDRGLSVHFCLDNDGTIYQLVDMQHLAWHAKGVNLESVGVEISNAYHTKHQSLYERRGFGPRPIMQDVSVHGRSLEDFLGFYPVQLEALKALWKAVAAASGVPLEVPTDADGRLMEGVDPRVVGKSFRGFINHYNVREGKIDCAGLDILKLMRELKVDMASD